MADLYSKIGFQFVGSNFGTGALNKIKTLVPIQWDRNFHKEVQNKMLWSLRGFIGEDTFSEGDAVQTAPGFPIIRKSQLSGSPGDQIRMGLRLNPSFGINTGKVGISELVNTEDLIDFYNLSVDIERHRYGTLVEGGLTPQRSPYDLVSAAVETLGNYEAQVKDTAIFYAYLSGWSPNIYRENGVSSADPTLHPNTKHGNDPSQTAVSQLLKADDKFNVDTLNMIDIEMRVGNFDPVMIDGQEYWLVVIHPYSRKSLIEDSRFVNALQNARERGTTNPLFRAAEYLYNNCLIFTYNKIPTGINYNSLTVSSKSITEPNLTGIGDGITAAQLRWNLAFGANAVAYAEIGSTRERRKEDDYGQKKGFGVDMIYGMRRVTFTAESGGATITQGGFPILNYAPTS